MVAIVFHCFPCFSKPSKNTRCSSSVQRPTFSAFELPFPDDPGEDASPEAEADAWKALEDVMTMRGGDDAVGALDGADAASRVVMVEDWLREVRRVFSSN